MWCQARRELLWQNIDGVCGPRPRPGRHAERERPGRFENAYLRQARPPTKRIEDPVSVNDIRRGRTAGLDSGKLKHPHPAPAFNTVRKPSRVTPAAHARALAPGRVRGRPPAPAVPPRIGRRQRPGKNVGRDVAVIPAFKRYPESALGDRRRAAQLNRPESYAVSALVAGLRSWHRSDQYHHPEAFQTAQPQAW